LLYGVISGFLRGSSSFLLKYPATR